MLENLHKSCCDQSTAYVAVLCAKIPLFWSKDVEMATIFRIILNHPSYQHFMRLVFFFKSARPVYYHLHLNLIKNKSEPIFFFKKSIFEFLTKKNCRLKGNFSEALLNRCPLEFRQKFISTLSVFGQKKINLKK